MYVRFLRLFALLLLPTSGSLAAPDGAELFARHCAVCHGTEGRGGVGTPLALDSFLSSISDRFLAATIRSGRPGRVMPAFPVLSNSQVKAIVRHIRGWSGLAGPEDDRTPIEGDPGVGQALFAQHCAGCHGDHGQGGTGTGVAFSRSASLPIIPPALNNPGFLAAASDRMIKRTIQNGRSATPMAGFRHKLSDAQIDDITSFVRSFGDTAPGSTARSPEPLVIRADSPYDLQQTVENVRNAARAGNFAVVRAEHQEYGLVAEGEEDPNTVFVDFCNFEQLYGALQIDPRIGMFLPCRITVVAREARVEIMFINPKALSPLFNNQELDDACETMYQLYAEIVDEATL